MPGIAKPSFWQPGFGNDWLEQLHELIMVEPQEFSLWPQGLGLYLLLAIVFSCLYRLWKNYCRRRKARDFQLQLLAQLSKLADKPAAIAGLSEFIKRLAMLINPGDKVKGKNLVGANGPEPNKFTWPCLSQTELTQIQTWAFLPPERLANGQAVAATVLAKLNQYMRSPAFLRQLIQGLRYD